MLPKYHILSGFLFAYIIYWFSSITIFQATLIFLSAVLIDFDHYTFYVQKKKDWSLKNAYLWHKALPKKHKPVMHPLHAIEFIILVTILSFYFNVFFFILIGMLFHSILDIIDMFYNHKIGIREFSLIRYLILRKKYPEKYFNHTMFYQFKEPF